jgi:hypothetical protein
MYNDYIYIYIYIYKRSSQGNTQLRVAFDRRLGGTHFKLQAMKKDSATKTEMHRTYLR